MMRKAFVLTALLSITPIVLAKGECEKEVSLLVGDLEQRVFGDLSEVKTNEMSQVIMSHCEQRKAKESQQRQDFFTDYMLSGESGNKPGNKRLKKR